MPQGHMQTCREDGHDVSVRVTYEEADMERFVREAVDSKVNVLVAAGGDGSINQVVSRSMLQPMCASLCVRRLRRECCEHLLPSAGMCCHADQVMIFPEFWLNML